MLFLSIVDFRAVVSAGGVLGSDVTFEDVKAAKVIWGRSVLKIKGKGEEEWQEGSAKHYQGSHRAHQAPSRCQIGNWYFLSTNTSFSQLIAWRSASPWSLIWHTMRKNISGKLFWWHTTCTYLEASISLWSLGIKIFLCSMHWPQLSPLPLVWIRQLHHNIAGSSNIINSS